MRMAGRELGIVAMAVLFTACGTSDGFFGDVAFDASSDATSGDASFDASSDTGPDATVCEDNLDCRGGEVCRDGLCLEACSADDPCSDPAFVCDEERGVCEPGTPGCATDDDCGPGQVCDDGRCAAAPCAADDDCPGGFTCTDGTCAPIDPVICESESTRCDGDDVVRCSRDGTRETREPCEGERSCVVVDGEAVCAATVCDPGEAFCVDGATVGQCDETGTALTTEACDEGLRCVRGACRDGACDPGSAVCEGGVLLVCNAEGTAERAIDCAEDAACDGGALGCGCIDGACAPLVCEPGAAECVATGRRECAADGSRWGAVERCADDQVCFGGECLDLACAPGDSRCAGGVALTCRRDGSGYIEENCAESDRYCEDRTGAAECRPRVCDPGSSTCTEDATGIVACDDRGAEEVVTSCGGGQFCEAGVCVARVCDDGDRTCVRGAVYACDAIGSGYAFESRCSAGQICRDGACVEDGGMCATSDDCAPRPATCDGDVLVRTTASGTCVFGMCDYSAVTTRQNCAASDRACDEEIGACVDVDESCGGGLPCSGDDICVDGICVECGTDADCPAGETCSDNVCIGDDPGTCSTDAECVAQAAALGYDIPSATCDADFGCIVPGVCGDGGGVSVDPFEAACPAMQVCGAVLSGFPGDTRNACKGCTVGDDSTCREGETCVEPFFPFPDAIPYCEDVDAPLPFP